MGTVPGVDDTPKMTQNIRLETSSSSEGRWIDKDRKSTRLNSSHTT
jgi:hypothetical protein